MSERMKMTELVYKVQKYENKMKSNISPTKKIIYDTKIREYRGMIGQRGGGGGEDEDTIIDKLQQNIQLLTGNANNTAAQLKQMSEKMDTTFTTINNIINDKEDDNDNETSEIIKLKNEIRNTSTNIANLEYQAADENKNDDEKKEATRQLLENLFTDTKIIVAEESPGVCNYETSFIIDSLLNYTNNKNIFLAKKWNTNIIIQNFLQIFHHLIEYDKGYTIDNIYVNDKNNNCYDTLTYNLTIKRIPCAITYKNTLYDTTTINNHRTDGTEINSEYIKEYIQKYIKVHI